MRIGLVSTLSSPVSPQGGSVEQLVWLLDREYTQLGHEVTVFGCAGSEVAGTLVETIPGPYGTKGVPDDWTYCEWINLCRAVEGSARFDVLHSHSYLWGLPLERLAQSPMLHTLHVMPHHLGTHLVDRFPDAAITAISSFQWPEATGARPIAIVPHGVDPAMFPFRSDPDDYLCWLGRFIPGKAPLAAIEIARRLGMRLVLAGKKNAYFDEHVAPLVDGRRVEYAGFLSPHERAALIGGAQALLAPFEIGEPFGLVLVEAMMCGTPVLATTVGATPEIVEDGLTGYLAMTPDELAVRATAIQGLDRARVRARAEERFSAARMARRYLEVYEVVLARAEGLGPRAMMG